MKINCSELFADSHLHLLVWNRFDEETHAAGLKFMCELMNDPELSGRVMPLLRPLGREPKDYAAFDACTASSEGHLPPDKCRWDSCEVWFQVAETAEDELWNKMLDWRQKCSTSWSKAWQSMYQADWRPLSPNYEDCTYCEGSKRAEQDKDQFPRYEEAKAILEKLEVDHRAWLLKTIWFRATEVIVKHLTANGSRVLKPCNPTEGRKILELLGNMLFDFDPVVYGIPWLGGLVDPSDFIASHIPVFAINALLPASKPHLGLHLPDPDITRPCKYESRRDYLRSVQNLMKLRWGRA